MDLTGALLRFAAGQPRALVVTAPGGTALRLAVEAELARRGWSAAGSPAGADLLVVAGTVVPPMTHVVDEVWRAMGAPRARVEVTDVAHVPARLSAGAAELADVTGQRTAVAARRTSDHDQEEGPDQQHDEGHGHDGDETAGMDMPGGLPMPDRGEDRDGLTLDRLHVPLGPALPDWPAGLLLRVTLQGDVVQLAEVQTMCAAGRYVADPDGGAFWDAPWLRAAAGEPVRRGEAGRRLAAAHLDSTARLLSVAGWVDAARQSRCLRDALLRGVPAAGVRGPLERLSGRVHRSRTLRWLTRGVGVLDPAAVLRAGLSGPAAMAGGDVHDRLLRWLTDTVDACARLDDPLPLDRDGLDGPRGRLGDGPPPSAALLGVLPQLLDGAELAAARLVVASLDPDIDELADTHAVAGGG